MASPEIQMAARVIAARISFATILIGSNVRLAYFAVDRRNGTVTTVLVVIVHHSVPIVRVAG
jgi:hypothetical protein